MTICCLGDLVLDDRRGCTGVVQRDHLADVRGEPLLFDRELQAIMFSLRNPLADRTMAALAAIGSGPVLGTGPLAETFPEPLSTLESDLWLAPLSEGLEQALLLTGTASSRALRRRPVVRDIDG